MALHELATAQDNGVIIPANIKPVAHGLLQAAADNDDFQEDTRDENKPLTATELYNT